MINLNFISGVNQVSCSFCYSLTNKFLWVSSARIRS
ncbi:hypothetical protein GECvBN5_gp174 [Salmonella phage GEC_vB_N5]|uniref:Uncharacterized protein n=1 Tax=Salmonella phage GEC_vB_N5 TaxID=2777378 RepID=A0A7S9XFM7_9CAUD|nr:hypothetical protein GECvBN5_gp174 [Salmonella phage GEC_vB_N5]